MRKLKMATIIIFIIAGFSIAGTAFANPYLDQLDQWCGIKAPDAKSEKEKLQACPSDVTFQIDIWRNKTKNPVDDFAKFAERCGIGDVDVSGGKLLSHNSVYFLVIVKGDRFKDIKKDAKEADWSDNWGVDFKNYVSNFYFELENGYRLYIVRAHAVWRFLDNIVNGGPGRNDPDVRSLPILDKAKNEKILYVPSGKIPSIQFNIGYKGVGTETFFVNDVPLDGMYYSYLNIFYRDQERHEMYFISQKVKFEGVAEIKDLEEILDFLSELQSEITLMKQESFNSFNLVDPKKVLSAALEESSKPAFMDKFDGAQFRFRLWNSIFYGKDHWAEIRFVE